MPSAQAEPLHPKKARKASSFSAPMVFKARSKLYPTKTDEEKTILRFKAAYVFDLAQTDGEPLPEFASVHGDPADHLECLKQFAAGRGISLKCFSLNRSRHVAFRAGAPSPSCLALSRLTEFAVLSHEIAHEMLHHGERRGQTNKVIRETEAEAVAFVVCQSIGLETGTAASDYIQLYSGDRETLAASLLFISGMRDHHRDLRALGGATLALLHLRYVHCRFHDAPAISARSIRADCALSTSIGPDLRVVLGKIDWTYQWRHSQTQYRKNMTSDPCREDRAL